MIDRNLLEALGEAIADGGEESPADPDARDHDSLPLGLRAHEEVEEAVRPVLEHAERVGVLAQFAPFSYLDHTVWSGFPVLWGHFLSSVQPDLKGLEP
jgi:hypothetical protein